MPTKSKYVKYNLVHKKNKMTGWDGLIDLAEKNQLWAKIRQEELGAAIEMYRKKRDAGVPFPGEKITQSP